MVHSVFLYPVSGQHDVASIEHFLMQRPDVLLDPLGTATYIVCGVPEAKEWLSEQRRANSSQFPYAVLITVAPDKVNIFQEYGDKAKLRSARDILQWILDREHCRIEDEYYNDWTERVSMQGVNVLYPATL